MKEHPILFSAPMVRAILDGRKTQTRRAIKPQPREWETPEPCSSETHEGWQGPIDRSLWAEQGDHCDGDPRRCPYGRPGDQLWVRETHYVWSAGYNDGTCRCIDYRATDPDAPCGGWTPSIHMPRWASRITLEITNVHVESLQDISENDARAEGIHELESYIPVGNGAMPPMMLCWKNGFKRLWEKINGPESWAANPWVWVVEFKRVQP